MDQGERPSIGQYRSQAARWRQLAAEATTPLARNHLLKLAQQCDFLAGGSLGVETPPIAADDRKGAEFSGAPRL
jgi:hypothetical protein